MCEVLTPATLAKVFRGELVPQDPADAPAKKILERIRREGDEGRRPGGGGRRMGAGCGRRWWMRRERR